MTAPWTEPVTLAEIARAPVGRSLSPDDAQRKALAGLLNVESLDALTARVKAAAWLDGAIVDGRWTATVTQICGVTLEPFASDLSGDFSVRVLPAGSPNAPPPEPEGEVVFEPGAEDPPDLIEGETLDLAAYVIEHLSLEIDPFPRKPGAVFDQPEPDRLDSPFAVLSRLKDDGG